MRKLYVTLVFLTVLQGIKAQDFAGYRAGNYTGVNGVFFNPAAIADSRYRRSFNLLSVSSQVGNNQASFKLKDLTESFDVDELKNQLIGSGAGLSTGFVSADIHGSSIMIGLGKKAGMALTTRLRTMANIIDVDGPLASKLINDLESDVTFPYTIGSAADMRVKVNAWIELGASYAQVLHDDDAHFVKGGFTAKYLGGVANAHAQLGSLQGTIIEDAGGNLFLQNTTGRIEAGFGGVQVAEVGEPRELKIESSGIGADLGLVYEFRPNHQAYRTGDAGDWRRDRNKYKLRVGVALLDVGGIKYDRDPGRSGAYDLGITGAERLNLDEMSAMEVDELKAYFDSHPQFFTPVAKSSETTYKVSLPTTLQLDVDYHLHRGFYAQLAAHLPLAKNNNQNPMNYTSITLTPRYEGRAIGLYVPVNYNSLTKLNAGVSLRLGPLFVGSGSLLSAAVGSSKQVDAHVGIQFNTLQHKIKDRKPKKRETTP